MAAPLLVSVFIPCKVLKDLTLSYLFGHYQRSGKTIFLNCTIGLENNGMLKNVETLQSQLDLESPESCQTFCFLGILYSAKKKKTFQTCFVQSENSPVSFVFRVDSVNSAFHLEYIYIKSYNGKVTTQVILYDSHGLMKSRLMLYNREKNSSDQNKNAITFLLGTFENNVKYSQALSAITNNESTDFIEPEKTSFLPKFFHRYFMYTLSLLIILSNLVKFYLLPLSLHERALKVLTLTRVGRQLHQRFLHCETIVVDVKRNSSPSLRCKNLISALLLDLICGWIITFVLLNSDVPLVLLDTSIEQTNHLLSALQKLIYWLMGVPAGLKLNIPLNSALGHFFLYHIYLWEAYMAVVLPVFTFILKISTFIGILGATFVLSLLSDVVSLATIHIYCFYGYATRLYGYQMLSLSALWRLFRGKKWNPLRQRVDSYTYDIHQLFLGTLIFTVLLFLLPTVMVYYFVFTSLRILVLIVQGILSKIINLISVLPLYAIFSRIFRSFETTGDVYFSIFNTESTLVLSVQTSQVSLMTVIKATLPELHKYEDCLTWKDFLLSIVWGKIIYPL